MAIVGEYIRYEAKLNIEFKLEENIRGNCIWDRTLSVSIEDLKLELYSHLKNSRSAVITVAQGYDSTHYCSSCEMVSALNPSHTDLCVRCGGYSSRGGTPRWTLWEDKPTFKVGDIIQCDIERD